MIPLLWMSRNLRGQKIDPKDWKDFAVVGLAGYFLTIFCIQVGISLTGASMASLINALTPVSVTILAAVMLKETITPIKVVCLILALAGAAVITLGAGTQSETLGIAVVLAAVIFWGMASVYMRRLTAKYPPILVTTYGMAFSLLWGRQEILIAATSIGMLAIAWWLFTHCQNDPVQRWAIVLVLGGGIGNLIDRIAAGRVVDYINLLFMDFAIFNFADICVCVGMALWVLAVILEERRAAGGSNEGK